MRSTFGSLVLLVLLLIVYGVACTTEGIEQAEMRKYDAKARSETAPLMAQAVVIDASLEVHRREEEVYVEKVDGLAIR